MERLSERARLLLREQIEEYEQLEALLLFFGERDRDWSAEEIAQRLKVSPAVAEEALAHLDAGGFIEPVPGASGRFRYAARTRPWEDALRELAVGYETDRLNVIHTMNDNALERLRTLTARVFADAFRLRRRKNDG